MHAQADGSLILKRREINRTATCDNKRLILPLPAVGAHKSWPTFGYFCIFL